MGTEDNHLVLSTVSLHDCTGSSVKKLDECVRRDCVFLEKMYINTTNVNL